LKRVTTELSLRAIQRKNLPDVCRLHSNKEYIGTGG
jgi:hypothetical protein